MAVSGLYAAYYYSNTNPDRDLQLFFQFNVELLEGSSATILSTSNVPGVAEREYTFGPDVAGYAVNFPLEQASATTLYLWWDGVLLDQVQIEPFNG